MSSKKGAKHHQKQPAASPGRGSRSVRSFAIAAVLIVAAAATLWWGRTNRGGETAPTSRSTEGGSSVALSSPESAQKLIGSWQRADAGYVIDIRSIDRFGAVDAVYLNPNPIHVSQARVSDAAGGLDLFIELMDVGYPGATYQLRYSPEYDALVGLYNQPTAGQDFEVAFERK